MKFKRKRNKKKRNNFKGGLEPKVWKSLPKKRGVRYQYESEKLDYVVHKRYHPDITVTLPDGRKFFIEIKGWLRPEDRTKMIAVKAFNPDTEIKILFAKDNPLYKGSKTKYSDWARKHGFDFSIGSVPERWLR